MKDPTRLLETSASELELRLLRAAASEQPPAAAMARLTHSLGLSVSSHRPHTASSTLQPIAASKLLIGVAAVGVSIASVVWVASRSTAPTHTPKAPDAISESAPPPAADPTPTIAPTSTLALEIARIDAIRKLLAADQAHAAIGALHDYQHDFPSGALRQESDVLSIEAQRHAGNRSAARALAKRFLAQNPDSPHSARVRELLNTLGSDAR